MLAWVFLIGWEPSKVSSFYVITSFLFADKDQSQMKERGASEGLRSPGSINWVNEQRLMLIGCYQEKNQVFFQES